MLIQLWRLTRKLKLDGMVDTFSSALEKVELRDMWQPTPQDGLWFHGGNLHQSRHYSQFFSLQLKVGMEGIDKPDYALQESCHKS